MPDFNCFFLTSAYSAEKIFAFDIFDDFIRFAMDEYGRLLSFSLLIAKVV